MRPKTVEDHLEFWNYRLTDPSFVYVIRGHRATPEGPVKIGKAKDVGARMRGLQTGNPEQLHLVGVVPGGGDLEVHLHAMLAHHRVPGTEWFVGKDVPRVVAYVDKLAGKMVDAYSEFGKLPDWREADPCKFRRVRRKQELAPVTVRFVEPDPVVPPEEAARMREQVRGCSRSAYLGDAPIARRRITVSQGFGN